MNVLFVLIPLSLVLLLVAIGVFIWAVKRGQFDNLESAALDILVDDEPSTATGEADVDPAADARAVSAAPKAPGDAD